MRVKAFAMGAGVLALAGCLETAGIGGSAGGPGAAIGGGGAVGDGAFVRDEKGCLYEVIAGAQVAIVGPDGRHDCGKVS